jgi:hypothetical protein
MSMFWIDIKSAWRGMRAMKLPNRAKWGIAWMPGRLWIHFWTPKWHEGNGPYLSAGFWIVSIYRGY